MITNYDESLFAEIRLLAKFPQESHMEGIKIHHDADKSIIDAAKSLYDKGMISQLDGGYLTDRGREVVVALQNVLETLAHD